MPFRFQWSKEYAIGDPVIDEQHKAMFQRVEKLFEALTHKRDSREIETAFKFLSDYVSQHFRVEESLMIRQRHKDYLLHKEKHQDFADQLEVFKRTYKRGALTPKQQLKLQHTLVQWLIQHITKMDRRLIQKSTTP